MNEQKIRLVERIIDIGTDAIAELQCLLDDMREASGDESDGDGIEDIINRWDAAIVEYDGIDDVSEP